MDLQEIVASEARAVAGLLGDQWTWAGTGLVQSNHVTIDMVGRIISYDTNHTLDGGPKRHIIHVPAGSTLGTYAALGKALHGLSDSSPRDQLRDIITQLAGLIGQLEKHVRDNR